MPRPDVYVITGALQHQQECIGRYELVNGKEAYSKPIWKHVGRDRFIAKTSQGNWMVQAEAAVGTGGGGHLQLLDKDCAWPHETALHWQEGDGKGWHGVPSVKLAADPPPKSYSMSAAFKHQSDCNGLYLIVPDREVFGKPVWKHVRRDRCIAKTKLGNWMVMAEAKVGMGGGGHLQLLDSETVWPHLTKNGATWHEGDGTSWKAVEGMALVADPPPARWYLLQAAFAHQSDCNGIYELVENRMVFGKVRHQTRRPLTPVPVCDRVPPCATVCRTRVSSLTAPWIDRTWSRSRSPCGSMRAATDGSARRSWATGW